MKIDLHVHFERDAETVRFQKAVLGKLNSILENEEDTMSALEDAVVNLEAQAAAIASVEDTVEAKFAALRVLIAELSAGQPDPALVARIQAASDLIMGKVGEFVADAADPAPEPAPEA